MLEAVLRMIVDSQKMSKSVSTLPKRSFRPEPLRLPRMSHLDSYDEMKLISVASENLCEQLGDGDEWIDLIRTLRVAEHCVHHLQQTNSYLERHFVQLRQDVQATQEIAAKSSQILSGLSEIETVFNKAVQNTIAERICREHRKDTKIVQFTNVPRKSRSAESSISKLCSSCRLVQSDKLRPAVRREKVKRKKSFGKCCFSCGAVKVSSQNSLIKCHDCNGEIIVQSLCSECNFVKAQMRKATRSGSVKHICSACDEIKDRRISWAENEFCTKCSFGKSGSRMSMRETCVYHVLESRTKKIQAKHSSCESSCCSDSEFASSCDVSYLCSHNCTNLTCEKSADSDIPWSDSDNFTANHDALSSVSSTGVDKKKLTRVVEETASIDEEFNTPRETLSVEELPKADSVPWLDVQSECCDGERTTDFQSTTSEEYVEAVDDSGARNCCNKLEDVFENTVGVTSESSQETFALSEFTYPPELDHVSERMERAQEALRDISRANCRLEDGITTIENVSEQNVKLSMILREIMIGMATHLEFIQKQTHGTKTDDCDSVEEFEEAVEELKKSDSDAETYYDIPSDSYCYLCLECGITATYKPMTKCSTCSRLLTEIPNGFLNGKETNSLLAMRHFQPGTKINWKTEGLTKTVFPMFFHSDIIRFPLSILKNRLKAIDKEAGLLKNSNDIVNVFVGDLQEKLMNELMFLEETKNKNQCAVAESRETRLVGFDVSVYKYSRWIREKRSFGFIEEVAEDACQDASTIVEMKMEEVFKKEQQTAFEIEVFEQKLAIEGLIIKEKESFYACSNEAVTDEVREIIPSSRASTTVSDKNQSLMEGENGDLCISIEIEMEKKSFGKERKAIRCEYKANLQKKTVRNGTSELEGILPTITLYPVWETSNHLNFNLNAECTTPDNRRMKFERISKESFGRDYSSGEMASEEFVEIKSPKPLYASSEDDLDSCAGDFSDRRRKSSSVIAVAMPQPVKSVAIFESANTSLAVVVKEESLTSIDEFFEAELNREISSFLYFTPVYHWKRAITVIEEEKLLTVEVGSAEVDKALSLIREIEMDVVEVKLQKAIEILPQLETVLRQQLRDSAPGVIRTCSSSTDVFKSAISFLSEGKPETNKSDERVGQMLQLLGGLEDAVKQIEAQRCQMEPDKIHELLNTLSNQIKESMLKPSVEDIKKSLQITSELGIAIRSYSAILRMTESSRELETAETESGSSDADGLVAFKLNSMKKKIFEIVTQEAQDRDSRIKKNFDRIARLEAENTEAMKFLDTLLDKTLRRVCELSETRKTVQCLESSLKELELLEKYKKANERFRAASSGVFQSESQIRFERIKRKPPLPSIQEVSNDEEDQPNETSNGLATLMHKLNELKSRTEERKLKYSGILGSGVVKSEIPTTKALSATITQFSRLSGNSYFVTWTKPEITEEDGSLVGYEILIDGKVYQWVRNPDRLKAVLFSQNPIEPSTVKLCALLEAEQRRPLTRVNTPGQM